MTNELTRRNFVTGLATGAAAVAALGVAGSAGAEEPAGEEATTEGDASTGAAALAEGSYTSTQHTPYATVDVTCTYSAGALTGVTYEVTSTSSADYFPLFESALGEYCDAIVANGKASGVDAVSGATHCSNAIKEGVNACMLQALGIDVTPAMKGVLNPQMSDYTSFETDCAEAYSPISLGTMELANRFVKSAGSAAWEDASGSKIPVEVELYGTMAENGVALNILAGGNLSGTGILPGSLEVEGDVNEALATLAPLVERVHAAGGKLGYQMCFGGLAPTVDDSVINETPVEELDAFIEEVGISAERGKQAGFDCIEIKGASADALNGFLTRRVNRREDDYGPQSIENRTRLFCRMIQKIKEVNGADFPVGALINGCEENDASLGENDLYLTVGEAQEIAKALEAAGADWIQVRVGGTGADSEMNIWAPDVQHCVHNADGLTGYGTMFDYAKHYGGYVDGSRSGFASFLPVAKAIKQAVSVPVGCAAYMDFRVGPDYLNDAIKNGELDLIFMNRPLNCDPELVSKMGEGRREDVIPCMKCMHCHDNIGSGRKYPSTCRMNATSFISLTETLPDGAALTPAATPRSVMVIGAGPAGLEAARVAAERGHTVELYDAQMRIGGLMPFARGVKGDHEHFEDYFTYMQHQLDKNGVTVHLSTTVDAAMVEELGPDVVVVATGGARENAYADSGALDPETAFGSAALGQNIVVLGGTVQAIDFAAYLVTEGKSVTIVNPEPEGELDRGQSGWFRGYELSYLYAKGVKAWNSATIDSVSATEVSITTETGLPITIACDNVIDLLNMVPNTGLADELEAAGYEVHAIGDCVEPFNIQRAVSAGNLCARAL